MDTLTTSGDSRIVHPLWEALWGEPLAPTFHHLVCGNRPIDISHRPVLMPR